MAAILNFEFFAKIAKHKNAYISKTVRDRAISTKFLTHRVSLQSSHPNFQKNFVSLKMAAILNFFAKIAKHKNAYILKTMLDRADYADFGCHNSIRLEAEQLTFISFSGHYLFFASDYSRTLCNLVKCIDLTSFRRKDD